MQSWFLCLLLSAGLFFGNRYANPAAAAEPRYVPTAPISKQTAEARAVNRIRQDANGIRVEHPLYALQFNADGVRMIPKGAKNEWTWAIDAVEYLDAPQTVSFDASAKPLLSEDHSTVRFDRGPFIEQYVLKHRTFEQQFLIKKQLAPMAKHGLRIRGRVGAAGTFNSSQAGWAWESNRIEVTLGKLTTYDERQREIPSNFFVSAQNTEIILAGHDLAQAEYPLLIDPEIGTNFRISTMGGTGNANYAANSPVTVFNPTNNEFFVVWSGDSNTGTLVDDEYEIFGQRINAENGALIGSVIRISDMGTNSSSLFWAEAPAVAYNVTSNEYLVVWTGNDGAGAMADFEYEIFGQRINAATGAQVGTNDFRISTMGLDGNASVTTLNPAIVYNASDEEYLVVWQAEVTGFEDEIYGRRISRTGSLLGSQLSISAMGTPGDYDYEAYNPKVDYSTVNHTYLVIWRGDSDLGGTVDEEMEVYGRTVAATTGTLGTQQRISFEGVDGTTDHIVFDPNLKYNPEQDEYFVVWMRDEQQSGIPGLDKTIGQRVNASTLALIGDPITLNHTGPTTFFGTSIVYNANENEYFVTWVLEGFFGPRLLARRVRAEDGLPLEHNFYINDYGPVYEDPYDSVSPAVTYDPARNQYLIVWSGEGAGLASVETEIHGQLYRPYLSDLSLIVTDSPDPLVSPGNITYSGTITNGGDELNSGPFSFSGTLPLGVTLQSVISSALTCSSLGSAVSCSGANLDAGQSVSFTITATVGETVQGTVNFPSSVTGTTGTDANLLNNASTASTTVTLLDTDSDTVPNISDPDDDNDGLSDLEETELGTDKLLVDTDGDGRSDSQEISAATNPLDTDSDDDGASDGQEFIDGSNPLDAGSVSTTLGTSFCSEWNGYLGGMYNIMEFVNLSLASRNVETTLYDIGGQAQSVSTVGILPGAQTDLLVHDMPGRALNSYGKVCSSHSGASGDVDGRMVYYRPNATGFDFAFAMPFQGGLTGPQFVPFNTYQPSLAPEDALNLVTNWIQITNLSTSQQSGTLIYYGQSGSILATSPVVLAGSARQDFSGHQFGQNLVGVIEWRPANNSVPFQLRNVRYYYDNQFVIDSFDAAFQLEGIRGSGEPIVAPLDTTNGSAILEIANVTDLPLTYTLTFNSRTGAPASPTQTRTLAPRASEHLIADSIFNGELGSAIIDGAATGSIVATAMHYGRNPDRSIRWIYGVHARQAFGSVLNGSYNTFLNQNCTLVLVNQSFAAQSVGVLLTRYTGEQIFSGTIDIAANGTTSTNICSSELANNYGVVRLQPALANSIVATVIRQGNNDNYRFPTPVRE